jgi:hypothetical protein
MPLKLSLNLGCQSLDREFRRLLRGKKYTARMRSFGDELSLKYLGNS